MRPPPPPAPDQRRGAKGAAAVARFLRATQSTAALEAQRPDRRRGGARARRDQPRPDQPRSVRQRVHGPRRRPADGQRALERLPGRRARRHRRFRGNVDVRRFTDRGGPRSDFRDLEARKDGSVKGAIVLAFGCVLRPPNDTGIHRRAQPFRCNSRLGGVLRGNYPRTTGGSIAATARSASRPRSSETTRGWSH